MSTERVIVDQSISKEFEAALREAAGSISSKRFDLMRKGAVEDLKATVDDAIKSVSLVPLCLMVQSLPSTSHNCPYPVVVPMWTLRQVSRVLKLILRCRALDTSSLNPNTIQQPHPRSSSPTLTLNQKPTYPNLSPLYSL